MGNDDLELKLTTFFMHSSIYLCIIPIKSYTMFGKLVFRIYLIVTMETLSIAGPHSAL